MRTEDEIQSGSRGQYDSRLHTWALLAGMLQAALEALAESEQGTARLSCLCLELDMLQTHDSRVNTEAMPSVLDLVSALQLNTRKESLEVFHIKPST